MMKFWARKDSTENNVPPIEFTSHHFQKNVPRIRVLMSGTEDLIIKELIFNGQQCCLMYLETMVEEEQINEKIIGPILKESTLIEDNSFSPFPQILITERPDRVTSYLNEGKVSIVVDGDPRILILLFLLFINHLMTMRAGG